MNKKAMKKSLYAALIFLAGAAATFIYVAISLTLLSTSGGKAGLCGGKPIPEHHECVIWDCKNGEWSYSPADCFN
jgi:hypothetical protein